MPEPSELFTNVYAKGYGVEVLISSLFIIRCMNLKYKQIKWFMADLAVFCFKIGENIVFYIWDYTGFKKQQQLSLVPLSGVDYMDHSIL